MDRPLSKYVRDRIKALPFNDRTCRVVRELLVIEAFAVQPPYSWIARMFEDSLRKAHPVAFAAINAELNRPKFDRENGERVRRLREARNDDRRHAADEQRQRERERHLWARARRDIDHDV